MNRQREGGFILVAVLWMLAALGALVSAYSVFAVDTAASAYLPEQRLQADAAIRAAIEMTAYRQLAWPPNARPSQGAFSATLDSVAMDVVYRAETARIDLNAAPRDVLRGLFVELGATSDSASFLAERIAAWRRHSQPPERNAEAEIYRKAGLAYAPVGAPFDNVLELAALPNMSPLLLAKALPFLTVYNSSGVIDPLIADRVVLAAIPGMTPGKVSAVRAAEASNRADPMALAAIVGPRINYIAVGSNDTVRATIRITSRHMSVLAEVVLLTMPVADEPYQVLYWRDDMDGVIAKTP